MLETITLKLDHLLTRTVIKVLQLEKDLYIRNMHRDTRVGFACFKAANATGMVIEDLQQQLADNKRCKPFTTYSSWYNKITKNESV